MERDFPKGKFFTAAAPYIDDIMTSHQKQQTTHRQRLEDERLADARDRETRRAKETRQQHDAKLIAIFQSLSQAQKDKLWQEALQAASSQFDRDQIQRARRADKPHFVLLQVLDRHESSAA
jgi:hypothetical protein